MDTLTHTVLGACLGEAIAGKSLGKRAMVAGALVNNLPDIDVILQIFLSPAQGLLAHRGITHSILMNVILSLLIARGFQVLFRKQSLPFRTALLLTASGLFLHIFLDGLTSYGTGWFEPFSSARISLNCLFILDPFLLLPLLVTTIALLIMKRETTTRHAWAITGLCIGLAYLLITFCFKIYVNRVIREDLQARHIPYDDYMAAPAPLNNVLWYAVAKNTDTCYVGYYSVFDATREVDYEVVPKNDALLQPHLNSAEVQRLLQFSQGYYRVRQEDSALVFSDIRFGQLGGWYKKNTPFVFSFNILGYNQATHLQQSRFASFEPEAIRKLYERAKGKR
jgi:inner membrane protein